MSFPGVSRTITGVVSDAGPSSSAFEVSAEDWNKVLCEVDEFYTQSMLKNIPTKKCFSLHIKNGVPVQPMKLQSKESRSALTKLLVKAKGHVYVHHSIIYLLYVPTILETTDGVLTVKLFNVNTGETIDVDTDSPLNEAAIFVARWPRAVHADDGDGIHLLVSAISSGAKHASIVGTVYPFWDDSLHKKKPYEKMYPTLRFPIEKSDAVAAIEDVKILQSFAKSRLTGGSGSNKVDINPQLIEIKSEQGKKAKTVDFKNVIVPLSGKKVENVPLDLSRDAKPVTKTFDGVTIG
uniref:Movement protein n=1 Tax=Viola white distortion associated virus TaxID=694447 RepID=D2JZZ4_9BROM|nr:movement protein [Viola white distortion associated virus]